MIIMQLAHGLYSLPVPWEPYAIDACDMNTMQLCLLPQLLS